MNRTVYSTDPDFFCAGCDQEKARCRCNQVKNYASADGIVRVGRESKGRKGKPVTTVTGAPLDDAGLAKLAKELKQLCGCGGAVKDGVIEIQGDQREKIMQALQKFAWKLKRSGG